MCRQILIRKRLVLIISVVLSVSANSQINELRTATVYDYLYRMAEKGLIRLQDYQLPLDRKTIALALDSLSTRYNELSRIENQELRFYRQEYAFEQVDSVSEDRFFLRKDDANRFRAAEYEKGGSKIFLDPVFGVSYLRAEDKSSREYYSGIRLAGYFGKRWGFNFSFRDNTEKGDTLTHRGLFSPVEGIVSTIETARSVNYSSFNYDIGYRWATGSLSAGQENLSWGYGLAGNIALSGRAPSFPFIKFDFEPWKWLHFSYFHGWLQSNIIDSSRSYNTGSGLFGSIRQVYYPKFIAHHSLTATPLKGLDISIGESIIYSDQLNFAYLIPINFFKVYDQYNSRYNLNAGDNSQFFGLISSRNHIRNTHIYAEVFVDELRASKIFNKLERRNQLGYTLGINRTDVFLHYLTGGIEYSRINPFVYNNIIPTQTYTSNSYGLGDWMGNNADRIYFFAQYVPAPKLLLKLWYQKIRKGDAGTLDQQYNQVPQPGFLFKKLFDYSETGLVARYEAINRFVISIEVNAMKTRYTNASLPLDKGIRFGFSYGL